MDRETLMMIATIVAIASVIFLFREVNKTKTEVENFKNFSSQFMHQLSMQREIQDQDEYEHQPEPEVEEKIEKLEE